MRTFFKIFLEFCLMDIFNGNLNKSQFRNNKITKTPLCHANTIFIDECVYAFLLQVQNRRYCYWLL